MIRASAIVAAISCVVFIAIWLDGGETPVGDEREAKVFATERGQRATVRLTDGTLVHLNAASSITLSPSFGTEQRSVRLEGEAYFEVEHDTTRPFVVRTGRATTQVLGTAFNVSAYPDDERVRVVVAEGKVAFETESPVGDEAADSQPTDGVNSEGFGTEGPSQGAVLTARQMATLVAPGRVVRGHTDLDRYLAWTDGELYYEDATFSEMARSVERWYDIDVVIDEAVVPSGHLNARFSEREPLGEVLNVIAAAFDLRYEREADTVRFYSSATAPVQ